MAAISGAFDFFSAESRPEPKAAGSPLYATFGAGQAATMRGDDV
jgi:hypothetical protein